MVRMFGQLLTTLSLLLCVIAAMLWARSRGDGERFGWRVAGPKGDGVAQVEYCARSVGGKLQLLSYRNKVDAASAVQTLIKLKTPVQPRLPGPFWESLSAAQDEPAQPGAVAVAEKEPASFRWYNETNGSGQTRGVLVPYWFLVVLTVLMPARAAWQLSQRGRATADDGPGSAEHVPLVASLYQGVSSVFFILAFLLACLWVRSWYVGDRVSWGRTAEGGAKLLDIHSGRGEFVLHSRHVEGKPPRNAGRDAASIAEGLNWRSDSGAAVGYTTKTFAYDRENHAHAEGSVKALTVALPFWAMVVVALLPPALWLRRLQNGPVHVITMGGDIGRTPDNRHAGAGPAPAVNQRPL